MTLLINKGRPYYSNYPWFGPSKVCQVCRIGQLCDMCNIHNLEELHILQSTVSTLQMELEAGRYDMLDLWHERERIRSDIHKLQRSYSYMTPHNKSKEFIEQIIFLKSTIMHIISDFMMSKYYVDPYFL